MKFHRGLRFKILASVFAVLCVYQGVSMLGTAARTTHYSADEIRACRNADWESIYARVLVARKNGSKAPLTEEELKCFKYGQENDDTSDRTDQVKPHPAKRDYNK